jgi:hypothetical protein
VNAPVQETESTALAVADRQQFDLSPRNFEQALTFSDYLADSDLVPKDFKGKPGNCLIAIQWGAELGLKPLQALQNLAIINGRPSLWGDAVIALVRSSPLCEYVIESDDGNVATCKVKRRGEPEQSRTFSMEDAQAAGLKGKQGPWTQYPKRMRQMRARAFALRDVFPDVLRGLPVAEEVMDTPTEKNMGPADVVGAPPPPAPPASWPADLFAQRLPEWHDAICRKKATVDAIVAKARTKYPLSAEQEAAIRGVPKSEATDATVKVTFAQVADAIAKAGDFDALALAGDLIKAVHDEQHRAELQASYEKREAELKAKE